MYVQLEKLHDSARYRYLELELGVNKGLFYPGNL